MTEFSIRRETSGDAVVLRLVGDLDMAVSPQLRDELGTAFEARPKRVIVDMKGVTFMDSSGISVLVVALRNSGRRRVTLALASPSPAVRSVLEMSAVGVFQIIDAPP